ncbi:HAD family hydrolase [Paratractidigestivibacter sp.]|uniref:HAD family hydrolase n=1 Tax=Paratractidigestivibacter sp. TaxID=2847316 RepID=UPI002ABD35D9|nr:HAD family hydrolase [Paratractidigestivibacter sp.]
MIKLALTDLDDTLIPFGQPRASEASRAAIHAVLDAGVHFGPVTGRLPADMSWMFDNDEACYATGAFANGQVVRVDGEVVREVAIPASALTHAQQVLDEFGGGAVCLYDPWQLGKIAYITVEAARLRKNPPPTWGDITQVLPAVTDFDTDYAAENGEPAYVKANIQTTCADDERPALMELLRREVPELAFVSPSGKAAVIDIVPLGWDKGCGVRVLARALGLAADELVAFGDSENDLAMIDAVQNSVAVANASEAVASRARWHIGACDDAAVDAALLDIASAAAERRLPRFMTEWGRGPRTKGLSLCPPSARPPQNV